MSVVCYPPGFEELEIFAGILEKLKNSRDRVDLLVCELGQIGKVTDVSRETGTIAGKIDLGFFNPAKAMIRISKQGDVTELSIQTNRDEGLLSGDGAQKALTIFAKTMGEDKRLSGKSTGGW